MTDNHELATNNIDPQEEVRTHTHKGVHHRTADKNSLLKPLHKKALDDHSHKKPLFKHRRKLTFNEIARNKAEALEEEYSCLKILFSILQTEEFKDIRYDSITYLDDTNEDELVIMSEKYKTHKIIRKSDFRANFNYSPNAFIFFLHSSGAVNERTSPTKRLPAGYHSSELRPAAIPKIGEYCLDELSGFWRKATAADVERLKKRQKEALYMKFEPTGSNSGPFADD